jgi:predicted amidohydrolase YtcJ
MKADLVLLNGKIVTVDKRDSIAEAVAVKFSRILAVGKNDEIRKLIGETTEVLDLRGRTVIPGLIDTHTHIISKGQSIAAGVLELSEDNGIKSIADIKKRIAEKASTTKMGEWIIGVRVDESKLLEKRHPTRWELDEAVPNHPVFISTSGTLHKGRSRGTTMHFCVVNSKAFDIAGISKDTPDPIGGMFERDPNTLELMGGVYEKAVNLVIPEEIANITRDEAAKGVNQILKENAAIGLTCIYEMSEGSHIRTILDLKNRGELPIRIRSDISIEFFQELNDLGIIQGLGDEWVKICGLKTFFDGAINALTALVSEPYLHKPNYYGVLSTTYESLRNMILKVYEAGYRISTHVNGDKAIRMYLDLIEEVQERFPREDPRNRIIHCTIVNPMLINRIKKLGLVPTIMGAYTYHIGDKLLPAFGDKRLNRMFAARWFLDAGIPVAAHSDHPASPFSPLIGIHALVNRVTKGGNPIGQKQKISVMEALKLYTINAAYHSFDEGYLGSIEEGKCADMVVLGNDILTVPIKDILNIKIDMTIIGGKTIYKREE